MCVKKTVCNHTHYYSKPQPSSTSNVGMPCGCGLIFNDIHRFFSFSLLPTYPILSSGSPEKQLIELVYGLYLKLQAAAAFYFTVKTIINLWVETQVIDARELCYRYRMAKSE